MYNMEPVANNIIVQYSKDAKRVNLKRIHHKKKNCDFIW